MDKNRIFQKIKDILKVDKDTIYDIFILSGYQIPRKRVDGYLKARDDKEFLDIGYESFGHFLDGLIIYKRGENYKKKAQNSERLTNNKILKKLRVAFELKESDIFAIFKSVGIDITKGELSSLFRSEDHKKFRYCPDSILELFLDGLDIYLNKKES